MSGFEVLAIVAILLVALAIGGAAAQRRRLEAGRASFAEHLEGANLDLAAAHAADRGWDPANLERAARAAVAERRSGSRIESLTLVQVVDAPGVEQDRVVFRVHDSDGTDLLLTMARRGDAWVAERLEG